MKKWAVAVFILAGIFMWASHFDNLARAQSDTSGHVLYLPLLQNGYDPSWQWKPTEMVSVSPTPFDNPFLAIDHAGRVHVFWDTWPTSGAAFIYHTYQTANGWSPPAPVANTLGISKLLIPPVVTPDGRIHLVWYNELAFGGPYRLMYASFDGSQGSPEEEMARFRPNYFSYPASPGPSPSARFWTPAITCTSTAMPVCPCRVAA